MAGKDYYLILGVARSESPARIRARYRDLVRALHPDVAGAQSAGAFREIKEAYEVLADPVTRRRHNIELATREERLALNRGPRRLWRGMQSRCPSWLSLLRCAPPSTRWSNACSAISPGSGCRRQSGPRV